MNTPRFFRIGSRGAARAAMCRPGACACVVRTPAERSDDAGAALRPRTRHPRVWLALTLAAVCLVAFLGSGAPDESADWVFRNGNILTLEGQGKDAGRVEALAVKGSRIVYAGNEEGLAAWSGPATRVVDLDGSTLMPGLIDAHFHLRNFGLLLSRLNLIGTKSWDEVVARVVERGAATSSGDWIFGRGWDQNDWDVKEFPTSAAIDSLLPGRLVYLRRVDGHAAVASRAALERAGIRVGTPDPPGGRILRDAAGVPTGVLIDAATTAVSSIIPEPTVAEQESLVAMAMRECAAAGLTGVHDMGTGAVTLEALQRMDASGRLPLRVYSFIDSADPSFLRLIESGPRIALGEERLSVRGVKIHLDGAMGSRGAAMLEPYSDDPQNTGLLQLSDEELRTITGLAWERGFHLATHAIGDRANRVILDRYEELLRSTDAGADWRPRVEHAQILAPEDVARFASLGVIASMQPTHATSDMPWAEDRVGAERIRGGYLWRTPARFGRAPRVRLRLPGRVAPAAARHLCRRHAARSPWGARGRLARAGARDGARGAARVHDRRRLRQLRGGEARHARGGEGSRLRAAQQQSAVGAAREGSARPRARHVGRRTARALGFERQDRDGAIAVPAFRWNRAGGAASSRLFRSDELADEVFASLVGAFAKGESAARPASRLTPLGSSARLTTCFRSALLSVSPSSSPA